MSDLHLTQAGFIKPIINELKKGGVNVHRLIHKAGLNTFSLDNNENYLPVNLIYKFFEILDREEGIDDCVESFGEKLQPLTLAQWGEMISFTPDLLTTCQLATEYDVIINTHERQGFNNYEIKNRF